MAKIAHYPGPDEPLYVPAEGEAIWLTDLEGHADIYDDDSIKINYAPGFDKSQITRIDVYRNGVKLDFGPALFDVLTNGQMKTFDGNPAENTPKSNHTDHAIIGYGYEFSFVGETRVLARVTVEIRNPVRFQGEVYAYIDQMWPWENPLMSDMDLRAALERVRQLGFAGIQLDTYYYMASATDNVLFAKPSEDLSVDWTRTPSDFELRRVLRVSNEVGLKTWLRVQVQVSQSYRDSNGHYVWRGQIAPTSIATWFEDYSAILVQVAALAESEGVDVLCFGVELDSMQRHTKQWADLVSNIRRAYSGTVSFSEGTTYLVEERCLCQGGALSTVLRPEFWAAFDQIAMTGYPNEGSCFAYSTVNDQVLTDLTARLYSVWSGPTTFYRTAFPAKEIAIGETGSCHCDGTLKSGYQQWALSRGTPDYQEVADFCAAVLDTAAALDLDRVAFWTYWLGSEGAPTDCTFNLHGSPAERVISSFVGH
jgi:hypothetical protein